MNHYDEEVLRLNKKIKQLIWRNEQNMSRNGQLEVENKRLSQKVEEMKEICTLTSTMNVQFKSKLEREALEKGNLKESNQKLKISLNKLSVKCNELNQRVKVLETNLKRKVLTRINQPRVQIIKSASDVVRSDNQALEDLQSRYDKLDTEHQEALNVIDELEFELDDIDYLESETQRLQQENAKLREMFQQPGDPTRQSISPNGQDVNRKGDNLSNLTLKAINEEEHDDGLVNELKGIHARKMIVQQKLEQFHHRQSMTFAKNG